MQNTLLSGSSSPGQSFGSEQGKAPRSWGLPTCQTRRAQLQGSPCGTPRWATAPTRGTLPCQKARPQASLRLQGHRTPQTGADGAGTELFPTPPCPATASCLHAGSLGVGSITPRSSTAAAPGSLCSKFAARGTNPHRSRSPPCPPQRLGAVPRMCHALGLFCAPSPRGSKFCGYF